MSACGSFTHPRSETERLVREFAGKDMIADFTVGKNKLALRAGWKHSPKSDLHIDVVRRKHFTGPHSVVNSTVDDIQGYFDRVIGEEIKAVSLGR
jgi:hypothetical protein